MNRRNIYRPAGLVVLVAILVSSVLAQGTLKEVIINGPDASRLNIVVFGDGYVAGQETQFGNDIEGFLTHMFANSPFDEYAGYFNVYSIFVESNETGADHPSTGIYKDTYFSSTYDSYGIGRLLTIPPNDYDPEYDHGLGLIDELLAAHKPDYDVVILLVNDTQYGGSGGSIAISSISASAPEIVMHELGHSFGDLADEYDTYTPGYSGYESPNTTAETVRELIKWTAWIEPSTPVPTPENSSYSTVVGLFEGACYETTGWYRPMYRCKMRALGYDFCPVCKEKIVKSKYEILPPIESSEPPEAEIVMNPDQTKAFSVVPMVPTGHSLDVQWYLDGSPIDGATANEYELDGTLLTPMTHTLEAKVRDNTTLVRNDPGGLLEDARSWTISFAYMCGDVYPDGKINLIDILFLIDYKYGSPPGSAPDPYATGDVNSDGNINLIDILYLIDYVYSTPPGPEPNCTF